MNIIVDFICGVNLYEKKIVDHTKFGLKIFVMFQLMFWLCSENRYLKVMFCSVLKKYLRKWLGTLFCSTYVLNFKKPEHAQHWLKLC